MQTPTFAVTVCGALATATLIAATTPATATATATQPTSVAHTAGALALQDPVDIPQPEYEDPNAPQYTSARFWQAYLADAGYSGATCTEFLIPGNRSFEVEREAASSDGWLAAVLVTTPGQDEGVLTESNLATVISQPSAGDTLTMIYEEVDGNAYYWSLTSAFLCDQEDASNPPPIVETDMPAGDDAGWMWAGAGVLALAGVGFAASRQRTATT